MSHVKKRHASPDYTNVRFKFQSPLGWQTYKEHLLAAGREREPFTVLSPLENSFFASAREKQPAMSPQEGTLFGGFQSHNFHESRTNCVKRVRFSISDAFQKVQMHAFQFKKNTDESINLACFIADRVSRP
jgi:hypothetical protein